MVKHSTSTVWYIMDSIMVRSSTFQVLRCMICVGGSSTVRYWSGIGNGTITEKGPSKSTEFISKSANAFFENGCILMDKDQNKILITFLK